MSKIQIPQAYISGIESLRKLTEEEMDTLRALMDTMPEGTGPRKFRSILTEGADFKEVDNLSNALFGFGALLTEENVDIKDLSEDLVESFLAQTNEDNVSIDVKNTLIERIYSILSVSNATKTTFKIYGVVQDNNNIFHDCRVLSDIRLLFDKDLSSSNLKKGIIVHRLKIDNRSSGKDEQSYFSLDLNDLLKLKQQIDRAIDKEALIKKEYINSINFIDITE